MKTERLLLVDDDEVFLGVLGQALARRGYEVLPAASIAEATEKARALEPQLAVVDLKLEQESGLDLPAERSRFARYQTTYGVPSEQFA